MQPNPMRGYLLAFVAVVLLVGGVYYHFSNNVQELQSQLAQTQAQLLSLHEEHQNHLSLKEENLRRAVEEQLHREIETADVKADQRLNELRTRFDSLKTQILENALTQMTDVMQNLTSTVALLAAPKTEKKHRAQWLTRLAEPEESDQVFYNDEWKPQRGYAPKNEGDKWIVMTSINGPTDSVRTLCALKGWKTVIVADLKTPKDWNHPGCIFLGVEEQNALPYKSIRYLPWKSYTRKNIGYLYAIEHGAKWILDTDDDNEPWEKEVRILGLDDKIKALTRPDQNDNLLTHVVNPYSYFGRPDIWPRGYPLPAVNVSEAQKVESARSRPRTRPLIQQALADLDPDVDAVFRLTRPDALTKVKFAQKDPVIIPPGTLCPFNSQNTIFHYEALWGLIIPSTVTIRVCDIWRGYWTQRMLWDIGGALTFLPATVEQIRNPHNYLIDFEQEIPMYMTTERFLKLLLDFEKPVAGETLFARIRRLAQRIADADLWKQHDVETLNAWLEDLEGLGYKPPSLIVE